MATSDSNSSKKISMLDIANLSGVSVATVSRVINGNGRFSAETEKRVMDVIKKYEYKINLSAKTLRTSKSQSIGIVVPDITNEFFAKIIRAVDIYALPINYTVFVCDSNENEQYENKHIENLVAKDVDGIIYISEKSDVRKIYEQYKVPVVYIDRRPKNAGTLVISDNEHGGYLATRELINKGCKKIIMLRDYRNLSPIRNRLKGYKKALDESGIPVSEDYIIDVNVDYEDAKEKVDKLIKQGFDFDGVFACTDMIGLGALHALEENKIKVPKQVKLVGFDDITASKICYPPMTTIRQDTESLGKNAVEELMKLIERDNAGNKKIIIDVTLEKRSTT